MENMEEETQCWKLIFPYYVKRRYTTMRDYTFDTFCRELRYTKIGFTEELSDVLAALSRDF